MGTQNIRSLEIKNLIQLEKERENIQALIDSSKAIDYRRAMGQFSTPFELAVEITQYGVSLIKEKNIVFLEPSFGTGSFFSALLNVAGEHNINATGIELDKDFYAKAKELWKNYPLELINNDFTAMAPVRNDYNLLIANPPYVRHQLISKEQKIYLCNKVKKETGLAFSGLAGLYCYFIPLAQKWLAPGAICGWLIPNEFMDVNYGKYLKEYLLNSVQLLRIHRYNPETSQFKDALVSSSIVWFRNTMPNNDIKIEMTAGNSLKNPAEYHQVTRNELESTRKWSLLTTGLTPNSKNHTIGDFFYIKRGIATGDNKFFIFDATKKQQSGIDDVFFTPVLPSPRSLKCDIVKTNDLGYPMINNPLFLLNCKLPIEEAKKHTKLWNYLQTGLENTATKYLCKNRKVWFWQEQRQPSLFLCSYMGRGSEERKTPFRFILNWSNAIVTNSYLILYPNDQLKKILESNHQFINIVWQALQEIESNAFTCEARIYGGGLEKIEPRELANVPIKNLFELLNF